MNGERERAEELLREAVEAYESADYGRCLRVSVEAEDLFTRIGDDLRAMAALQRQAMVWAVDGNLDMALEINRRLVAQYRELGDEVSAAKCGTNLAYNLRLLGRHREGREAYLAAWRVFVRLPDRVFERAMTHMNLGQAHRQLGDLPRAYAHARQGERLFSSLGGQQPRVIDCVILAARVLDRLDRYDEADALRRRAGDLARQMGNLQRLASVHHSRGGSLAERSRFDEALTEERAALTQCLTASNLNVHLVRDLLRNIARLHIRVDRPEDAWPFALLATRLTSRTLHSLRRPQTRREWRMRHAEIFDLACGLLVRREAFSELATMLETARAQQPIDDGVPLPRLPMDGDDIADDDRIPLAPLPYFTLGAVGSNIDEAIDAVVTDLTGALAERHDCRTALAYLARTDWPSETTVDLRDLGRRIAGETGLVWGTLVLRSTLYWYVVDTEGTHGGSVPVAPGTPLGDALKDVAEALPGTHDYADRVRDSWTVTSDSALRRLADVLLVPSLRRAWFEAAAVGEACRVVFIPAPEIARLPIAALPLPPDGEPLLRSVYPVYIPSPALATSLLATRMPRVGHRRAVSLVVADPKGDLPGARRLARAFATGLTSTDTTREKVTRALARARSHTGRDATFVYVGHTTSPDDAGRSVLVLADGDLAASEWLSVQGQADFAMPSGVVLLSCSSGGLGVMDWYGLATAALAAGATTVVVTLWPHLDSLSSVDLPVIKAVAAGGDAVANVYELLNDLSSKRSSIARSPYVWANYAVIAIEPVPSAPSSSRPRAGADGR